MKMTLDLPPELVREMKLRAVHENRKLKDIAAELLARGLSPGGAGARKGEIKFPLFPASEAAPATGMTIGELLALEQESLQREDSERLGLSL